MEVTSDPRLSEQLLTASGRGLAELVQMLLRRGASASFARPDGWTALMAACSGGHRATASLLLEHGADLAAAAPDGYTALIEACTNGHRNVAELLLSHSADPGRASSDGTAPIVVASMYGHADAVGLLLDSRASPAQATQRGFTALRAACGNGHDAVATMLLACHRDPGDEEAAAAFMLACANGHAAVARQFLRLGTPATTAAKDGTTALMQAAMASHREVVTLLIDARADMEGALKATSHKNLIGARRVLEQALRARKAAAGAPKAEAREDLDRLVHAIEGGAAQKAHRKRPGGARGAPGSASIASPSGSKKTVTAAPLPELPLPELSSAPEPETPQAAEDPALPAEVRGPSAADAATGGGSQRAPESEDFAPDGTRRDAATASEARPVVDAAGADAGGEASAEAARPPEAGAPRTGPQPSELGAQALAVEVAPPAEVTAHALADALSAPGLAEASVQGAAGSDADSARLNEQLLSACVRGLDRVAELLVERLGPARLLDCRRPGDGRTPLMAAAGAGHAAVVEVLLGGLAAASGGAEELGEEARACLNRAASDGFTSLMEASAGGHPDVASRLLRCGAAVGAQALDGTSPLILASLHGHAEIAALLLEGMAEIAHARRGGSTALQAACGNGHVAVADLLLQGRADLADEGVLSLVSACANGHTAVARRLVDGAGVSARGVSGDGTTALLQACMAGHHETAAFLVSRGAPEQDATAGARRHNCLSGVRRVLNRARGTVAALTEEVAGEAAPEAGAQDLDALVREIEGSRAGAGPSAAPPVTGGANGYAAARRRPGAARIAAGRTEPDSCFDVGPTQASDSLGSDEDGESPEAGAGGLGRGAAFAGHLGRFGALRPDWSLRPRPEVQTPALAAADGSAGTAAGASAAAAAAPGASGQPELAQPPTDSVGGGAPLACGVFGAALPSAVLTPTSCPLGPARSLQAQATTVQDLWPTRQLFTSHRAPGTFYTIEVLGVEPAASASAPEGTQAPEAEDPRGGEAPPGAGRQFSTERGAPRNAAVVSARCAGRPVSELRLIPYDLAEIADRDTLIAGRIPCIDSEAPGFDWDVALLPSPPLSSRSTLPDRDEPEEYAAWCSDLQRRRCEAAASVAPLLESGLAGLAAF